MENEIDPQTRKAWEAEFEAAARRPLEQRIKYAFIHTYKPVLDDAPFRSFDTMEQYRRWCEEKMPDWLGYGRGREAANCERVTLALKDLGFNLSDQQEQEF